MLNHKMSGTKCCVNCYIAGDDAPIFNSPSRICARFKKCAILQVQLQHQRRHTKISNNTDTQHQYSRHHSTNPYTELLSAANTGNTAVVAMQQQWELLGECCRTLSCPTCTCTLQSVSKDPRAAELPAKVPAKEYGTRSIWQ